MSLILGANQLTAGGYEVDNSLRFNSGSSDFLNRTPASSGNRQTWTWSGWFKKAVIGSGAYEYLFDCTDATNSTGRINNINNTTDSFQFADDLISADLRTTAVYRDASAWYHLIVAMDTTQATASDRIKMYVNGSQITSFSTETYPSQNANGTINLATGSYVHRIGTYNGSASFFNGYQSEVYFIDGQALTPSDFGEFDSDTNIWKPIPYTGSFGTNGFYLEFKDSSALGDDTSGNGNDFTVNNLTSVDQSTDTCTNNFATWNPLDIANPSYVNTLTEGNLKAGNPTGDSTGYFFTTFANFSPSQGKWYWEVKADSLTTTLGLGIYFGQNTFTTSYPYDAYVFYCLQNGSAYYNGSVYSYMASYTSNDILTFALDMDSKKLYIGKNGSWANGSGSTNQTFANAVSITTVTASFPTGRDVFPILVSKNTYGLANFGSPFYSANSYTDGAGFGNFSYAVPSGYYALNTKNLAQYG